VLSNFSKHQTFVSANTVQRSQSAINCDCIHQFASKKTDARNRMVVISKCK